MEVEEYIVNDFTDFILEEKYRHLKEVHEEAFMELGRLIQEKLEVEKHPKSTIEDREWARRRAGVAQERAANALRAIYSLPALGQTLRSHWKVA